MGIIYKISSPPGKVYIGQTTRTFKERMAEHKYKTSGCILVRNAIQKYGDKIVYDIIEEVPNEKLDEREIFWIKEFNSMTPNGYNCVSGGHLNKEVSQLVKDKMSTTHRHRHLERNGYEGTMQTSTYGFYPKVCVDGKTITLSDGACSSKEEASDILKEYMKDPENFVKKEGSKKRVSHGCVFFHKTKGCWEVKGKKYEYLGKYETKEEADKIFKEYSEDPENFVRPDNTTKRKNGCVFFNKNKNKKKWCAVRKVKNQVVYCKYFNTMEEAETALDKHNENFKTLN